MLDQNSKAVAIIIVAVFLFCHACSSTAVADESAAALTILRAKCGSCHNAKNPKAELDLTSLTGVLIGGESGLAIDKDAANSLLWGQLTHGATDLSPTRGLQDTDTRRQSVVVWLL